MLQDKFLPPLPLTSLLQGKHFNEKWTVGREGFWSWSNAFQVKQRFAFYVPITGLSIILTDRQQTDTSAFTRQRWALPPSLSLSDRYFVPGKRSEITAAALLCILHSHKLQHICGMYMNIKRRRCSGTWTVRVFFLNFFLYTWVHKIYKEWNEWINKQSRSVNSIMIG